jgi:sugar lactone lactonase YvrE
MRGELRILVLASLVAALLVACKTVPTPLPESRLRAHRAVSPESVEPYDIYENRKSEAWAPLLRVASVAVLSDASFVFTDLGSGRMHQFDADGFYVGGLDAPGGLRPLDVVSQGLRLFVLDNGSRRILRFTRDGVYRDVFLDLQKLDPISSIDPSAMDIDRDGRIAVADVANHRVVVTSPFLEIETIVGEYGSFPGQFDEPRGVVFSRDGLLYVSDRGNRRVQVFDHTGFLVAGTASVDDAEPVFVAPSGMATDEYGNLFVCDSGAGCVVVLTPDLKVIRKIGEGDIADTDLRRPVDCAFGPEGKLFVTDASRNALVIYEVFYP